MTNQPIRFGLPAKSIANVVVFSLLVAGLGCSDKKDDMADDMADQVDVDLSKEQGWPMYGFNLENTQVYPYETDLSADTVADLAPKWQIQVGGGSTSTPAVVDGVAYFGAWDGYFYAVNSKNAKLIWKKALGRSWVRSSPLVTEDTIYVAYDRSLAALSREDGEVLFETELIKHPQGFMESSPKLADGVVVIGTASFELNLEKDDYTFAGTVVGVNANTGKKLWTVPVAGDNDTPCHGGDGVSVWSSAAIDPELGLAYIGTGQTYEAPASTCNDTLLAIHYKKGFKGERLEWKQTYTKDDVYVATGSGLNGLDHDIGGSPNLFMAGKVKAVGVGDKGGTYRVFNRETGKQLWRADLNTSSLAQLGGVMTTAAVYEDTVYVTSNSWMAFGFIVSGQHSDMDTSTLYALNAETGEERWTKTLDAPVFGSFAIANGILFHPTIRGDVYARDAKNGKELWKVSIGAPIGSGISVSQDSLYVSGGFGLGTAVPLAIVTAFGISPDKMIKRDFREPTFLELTAKECDAALADLQPDDTCRSCLCDCDPSTTGACEDACWAQASCIVDNCADTSFDDETGVACYEDHCTSKLLPPNVYQQSTRSAGCVLSCMDSCNF